MLKDKRIGIAGRVGAGKTTVAAQLARRLGVSFYSAGNLIRDNAALCGMSISQYMQMIESDAARDSQFHKEFEAAVSQQHSCIVEYRLAFLLRPKPYCVFLDVSEAVALERLRHANRLAEYPLEPTSQPGYPTARDRLIQTRLLSRFSVDILDIRNFDSLIQTDQLGIEDVVGRILADVYNERNIRY